MPSARISSSTSSWGSLCLMARDATHPATRLRMRLAHAELLHDRLEDRLIGLDLERQVRHRPCRDVVARDRSGVVVSEVHLQRMSCHALRVPATAGDETSAVARHGAASTCTTHTAPTPTMCARPVGRRRAGEHRPRPAAAW